MKYPDSAQRSAEFLRIALALMSKHNAALHPITYAVWYEYASGRCAALKSEIDAQLNAHQTIDEDFTRELYQRYIADLDTETVDRLNAELQRVLDEMSTSAARTGHDASEFGDRLEKLGKELKPDMPASLLDQRIEGMVSDIQNLHSSIRALTTRLDSSRNEIERLKGDLIQAREEALIDGLSGLLNRKAFDQRMLAVLSEAWQSATSPSLVLIDIDQFKRINDNFGHLFGDAVIRTMGQVIKNTIKGQEIAGRYGGDEFALLLPDTPLAGGRAVADKLRFAFSQSRIRRLNSEEPVGNITISAGVATHRRGEDQSAWIARADAALYASKIEGRNRVTAGE